LPRPKAARVVRKDGAVRYAGIQTVEKVRARSS
jgi:hypothetical protein